jgi:hypothetical protein
MTAVQELALLYNNFQINMKQNVNEFHEMM